MAMFNPPHPGEALREDVLPALGLSITTLATHLGYSRGQLSTVLNCRAAISADLAWRLEWPDSAAPGCTSLNRLHMTYGKPSREKYRK